VPFPPKLSSTADQTTVRRANLTLVVRHIATNGRMSRARIAAETGLTRGTVSSLVSELLDLRLLHETGEPTGPPRVGRPGLALELGESIVGIGLEANVDYLAVSVEDLRGEVRYERRVNRENRGAEPGPVLDLLARMAAEAIQTCDELGLQVAGITVAVPGIVDVSSETLMRAPNLGWSDMRIADELRTRLGLDVPVHVENESNLAAVAEHWLGAVRGVDNFIIVFGEVGVGGGIFLRGELFRGSHGFGGEIGHATVVHGGLRCVCGSKGCLEAYVGLEAMARTAGIPIEGERTQSLAAELARGAEARDERVLESLAQAGGHLGTAIASVVNLFDLEAVVLGGRFTVLYPWLYEHVNRVLGEQLLAVHWVSCEIRASELGEAAAVRGAAALSLRRVLEAPWLVSQREIGAAI
jgi:predicted NBD/HSP70 family sugar kinase